MHAFLIIGNDQNLLRSKIAELAVKLDSQILEFTIGKIDEVRDLEKFTKLKVQKKTAILLRDVDKSTLDALNAFLKNLEEPQVGVNYILTASSEYSVLPTISSRCQIIRLSSPHPSDITYAQEFLGHTISQKLAAIDQIRERPDALAFVTKLILSSHNLMITTQESYHQVVHFSKTAQKTLNSLKASGNVGLQLTNFVVKSGLPEV